MLFSNRHEENFLWGLSKCCALQELFHSRVKGLLRGSLWKANILFKNKPGCSLAVPEHSVWVPLGLSAFVADGFMSTSAFLKRTLNILIVFVSVVYSFLKNLSHCTVIFRNNIAFAFRWKMWIDAQGVSLWLIYFIAAPEPFHSFPSDKKKKRATEAESGFQCSKRPHCVSSPKHSWGDRNKYIARMLLCKSKEQQHPHLEGLVPRSLLELWARKMKWRKCSLPAAWFKCITNMGHFSLTFNPRSWFTQWLWVHSLLFTFPPSLYVYMAGERQSGQNQTTSFKLK